MSVSLYNQSLPPIPSHLSLSDSKKPWEVSPSVFQRLQPEAGSFFRRCELLPSDPEYHFVYRYFHYQLPTNRAIKHVFCVHNGPQSEAFLARISVMEQEAKNAIHNPQWEKDSMALERKKTMQRFEQAAAPFSSIAISRAGARKDNFNKVKLLPVWHGSDVRKCKSICDSGFTFFGKHTNSNNNNNTDDGYFGSGIYFTNSARYATDIYSDGENLMLAWVSMREPYPVVSDAPAGKECSDMNKLKRLGHYENYNAHYIPVISTNPQDKKWPEYFPCNSTQEPDCDELVVFDKAQTLARYWVVMQVDLPTSPNYPCFTSSLEAVLKFMEELISKGQEEPQHELAEDFEVTIVETLFMLSQSSALERDKLDNHTNEIVKNCLKLKNILSTPAVSSWDIDSQGTSISEILALIYWSLYRLLFTAGDVHLLDGTSLNYKDFLLGVLNADPYNHHRVYGILSAFLAEGEEITLLNGKKMNKKKLQKEYLGY